MLDVAQGLQGRPQAGDLVRMVMQQTVGRVVGIGYLIAKCAFSMPAPFDFVESDAKTKRFERIADEEKLNKIGREISPITHVSADDPPMLIIHGDKDKVVPIQQANIFIDKLKEAKVPCELVLRPGADHGWATIGQDLNLFADWFDKHLAAKP